MRGSKCRVLSIKKTLVAMYPSNCRYRASFYDKHKYRFIMLDKIVSVPQFCHCHGVTYVKQVFKMSHSLIRSWANDSFLMYHHFSSVMKALLLLRCRLLGALTYISRSTDRPNRMANPSWKSKIERRRILWRVRMVRLDNGQIMGIVSARS
jgi:hypothetical protein